MALLVYKLLAFLDCNSEEFLNLGSCFETTVEVWSTPGSCLSLKQMLQCCGKNSFSLSYKEYLVPAVSCCCFETFQGYWNSCSYFTIVYLVINMGTVFILPEILK